MRDTEDHDQPAPATWENVVVGEAKQALGHVVGSEELIDEGEDQVDVAIELRGRHGSQPPE